MHDDMRALDWIERRAFADLVAAQRPERRQALGLAAEVLGESLVLRCDALPSLLLNRVIGLGVSEPASAAQLRAALAGYRQSFFVHVSPKAEPADQLFAWLQQAGLTRYRRAWHKLSRGVAGPLPQARTSLGVRPAELCDAAALGVILAQAFDLPCERAELFGALVGRPGWHVFVAAEPLEPAAIAATGLLYVERDIGYLAGAATHPSQRCRGAQLALMVARIQRALELGCRIIASETGEPVPGDPQHSHRNMERCGLSVVERRENWACTGTSWQHGPRAGEAPVCSEPPLALDTDEQVGKIGVHDPRRVGRT